MPDQQKKRNIAEAIEILKTLGLPRAQQNERSAICLLALLNVTPGKTWSHATDRLLGIRGILDFARQHYGKPYAENTRETIRRQTMHQFLEAQIALYNPDDPKRPVNSPKAVYQIAPAMLALVRTFGTGTWANTLAQSVKAYTPLVEKFGRARAMAMISIKLSTGQELRFSPGAHSEIIRAVVQQFAPRFAPGGVLVYAGDTGAKWAYFDESALSELGVEIDDHGKMPNVVIHHREKNWVFLVESVTSHGPIGSTRQDQLRRLFLECRQAIVYVTAFPTRAIMKAHLDAIAWETEVWVAEAPTHLIHFNGERFLGPR